VLPFVFATRRRPCDFRRPTEPCGAATTWEPGAPPEAREALERELEALAGWLGLADVAGPGLRRRGSPIRY
jgi:hypothetical protein